ncbi:MAG: hypothetical protein HOC71_18840 [Candidatus Latescibacteria bacterium]|nr:hypothetical protein [Candidatus Latescibacterota bacterium]
MARNRMEAEGISTFLADVETVGVAWHLGPAVGGVKIRVQSEYVELAQSVLKDIAGQVAPQEMYSDEAQSRRAFRAAALGVIFPPLQLYSLWLIGRLLFTRQRLGIEAKRYIAWTVVLDLWIVVYALTTVIIVMGRGSFGTRLPLYFW